jgi:DNA-binding response OmpR family regulator
MSAATAAKRILVVEDNHDLRHLFRDALSLAGFEVLEAADGLTALQVLDGYVVDLVVLDLRLPILSGFDVHAEVRAFQDRKIPILVVTALSLTEIAGINGDCILQKPVLPEELVRTVAHCLASGPSR